MFDLLIANIAGSNRQEYSDVMVGVITHYDEILQKQNAGHRAERPLSPIAYLL